MLFLVLGQSLYCKAAWHCIWWRKYLQKLPCILLGQMESLPNQLDLLHTNKKQWIVFHIQVGQWDFFTFFELSES